MILDWQQKLITRRISRGLRPLGRKTADAFFRPCALRYVP